ncbi:MAG TPA: MFS transporter [Dehalococcoidia bacterium]|nr:MFS transporter [Dehalococcoidia bacterium]
MTQPPALDSSIAARLDRKAPFFYGWIIVVIGFLCVFWNGATSFWAMPVFVDPMSDNTGWSHASIFAALSVRFIVSATGGLVLGGLTDRKGGASRILLFGVLLDMCALLAVRWAGSPYEFVLIYGVIGGIGGTGTRLVQATLISKWFVARRGTAVGFTANGGGIAAIVMAPVTAFLIDQLGWRDAWGALGIMMAVMLIPLVPLAVRSPEDLGLEPDNGVQPRRSVRSAATERSFRLADVIHTWQFWLLLTGVLIGNFSLQTHTVVMVPHFKDLGFSAGIAAASLSVYGLFSISMRFVWGNLADRFSVRIAIIGQSLLTAVGAFLLMQVSSTTSLYVIMAFEGMTLSGYPPLQILVWPEFFGRMHIGSIIGTTQFFSTLAGALGPIITGIVFDQTGSYELALWLLVVTWLTTTVVMLAVKPAGHRADPVMVPVGAGQDRRTVVK